MDKDLKIKREAIDMYKSCIEICKDIGAITEMEYEYKTQDPLPLFDPYLKMSVEEEGEFLKVVEELGRVAEGSDAYVLLEPVNRYECKYLNRLQDNKELLDKVELSNVGLLADFFHMAIEEADLPNSIMDYGNSIKHVHLGDNNRLLPGYGHTDWAGSFKALKQIGFRGFMNLECGIPGEPEVELPKAAEYLKNIISEID
jgi:sugar phosphate isomerase/epimerase